MQIQLVFCFLLCIFSVSFQDAVPVPEFPEIPEIPDIDLPPFLRPPVLPIDGCNRRFGRYTPTDATLSPQPVSEGGTTTQYFYHECSYYKPSYSECKGGCSHQRLNVEPYRVDEECGCCRAQKYQRVPVTQVYCNYIFAYNGCDPPTITSEWVYASHPTLKTHPEISQHRYYVVHDCKCSPCDEPRSSADMASMSERISREVDPRGPIDTDLPEEFQGLEGQDVESRADVTGLGPLPRPGRPNICPQVPREVPPGPAK